MNPFFPSIKSKPYNTNLPAEACAQPPVAFVALNGEPGQARYSRFALAGPSVPPIL